jgi:hypothetical protein
MRPQWHCISKGHGFNRAIKLPNANVFSGLQRYTVSMRSQWHRQTCISKGARLQLCHKTPKAIGFSR